MAIKIYSKHCVTDGKWEVTVHVLEEPDTLQIVDIRQHLRVMLDKLYNSDAVTIVKTLLSEVMDAAKVEVQPLYGPTIVGTRE